MKDVHSEKYAQETRLSVRAWCIFLCTQCASPAFLPQPPKDAAHQSAGNGVWLPDDAVIIEIGLEQVFDIAKVFKHAA